jgi:hypothetical protein
VGIRFQLLAEDGTDLGPFATSEPNWRPGHRIYRGHDNDLEVVRTVPAQDGEEHCGYLVVRPVT